MKSNSFELAALIESKWGSVIDNYSPFAIEFYGTLIIQVIFFWLPSLIYGLIDPLFPEFSERHKLQPAPKQPTRKEILHCLNVVATNQVISAIIHVIMIKTGEHFNHESFKITKELPSIQEFIVHMAISFVVREALFYYAHRFFHMKWIYPKIHKKHHKFTAPVALAAQYAHPAEELIANILPITLPPQILHSHIITFWIFMAFQLLETTTVHSGYDFWGRIAIMHDKHHEKFMINFGAYGLLDWFHGTNKLKVRQRNGNGAAKKATAVSNKDEVSPNGKNIAPNGIANGGTPTLNGSPVVEDKKEL